MTEYSKNERVKHKREYVWNAPRTTACGMLLESMCGKLNRNITTVAGWNDVTCRNCLRVKEGRENDGLEP